MASVLVSLVVAGGLIALLRPDPAARTAEPPASPVSTAATPAAGVAVSALAALEVSDAAPPPGYTARLFNFNGFDFDRNGCDSRNDTLARDLTDVVFRVDSNDCRVESGILHDRYSAEAVPVTRDQVDIDHVVSLGNAWASGAATWSPERRQDFANDPLVLVATQARHNRAKSSRDATRWLPPAESAHCAYAARQVAVKQRYELTVTTIEMDVLGEILTDCPDEPLPDGSERPNRIPAAAVAPTSAAAPGAASASATAPGGVTRPRVLATPDEQGVYRNVAPGAYCSPLGAAGTTDTGTPMVCRLSATGDRPRWRAA